MLHMAMFFTGLPKVLGGFLIAGGGFELFFFSSLLYSIQGLLGLSMSRLLALY